MKQEGALLISISKQLLHLCTARTVWSDAEIRHASVLSDKLVRCDNQARFGPCRFMYYPDGDPVSKVCMIPSSRRRIPESYEVCRLIVPNDTSYDSVVLTKDTAVIRGSPIDGGQ